MISTTVEERGSTKPVDRDKRDGGRNGETSGKRREDGLVRPEVEET